MPESYSPCDDIYVLVHSVVLIGHSMVDIYEVSVIGSVIVFDSSNCQLSSMTI